ncbi:hypothetical protein LINPERPRIM_LOCUS13937 [Linum perenne]
MTMTSSESSPIAHIPSISTASTSGSTPTPIAPFVEPQSIRLPRMGSSLPCRPRKGTTRALSGVTRISW